MAAIRLLATSLRDDHGSFKDVGLREKQCRAAIVRILSCEVSMTVKQQLMNHTNCDKRTSKDLFLI